MFLTSEKFTPQKGACFKIVPPSKTTAPPPTPGDVINDRSLTILLKSVSEKTLAKESEYNFFFFCPTLLFAIFLFVCLDLIVVNILCFQTIDIFFMNFASIILFLPTTFTHTHDPRHLPTPHDPRHLATLLYRRLLQGNSR